MSLIVLLLVLLLLFGGGGFYLGGPAYGDGTVGVLLFVLVVVWALGGL